MFGFEYQVDGFVTTINSKGFAFAHIPEIGKDSFFRLNKVVNMPQGRLTHGMHLQMKIAYDSKNRGRSGIRSKGDVIFVQPDFHHNHYNPDQRYEDHQPNQHYEDQLDYPPFPHDILPFHMITHHTIMAFGTITSNRLTTK